MKKHQNGFGAVELLIIIVVLGLLGGAGWYVWQRNAKKTTDSTQKSTTTAPSDTAKATADACTVTGVTGVDATWKKVESKTEKASFCIPPSWTVATQESDTDEGTEDITIKGPNDFELQFGTRGPSLHGSTLEPILHVKKIEVPNFGPLYSLIPEYDDGTSFVVGLTDYDAAIKDGDKTGAIPEYTSKRTGTFEPVFEGTHSYIVDLSGRYLLPAEKKDSGTYADFPYAEFAKKPEVLVTQTIFKTLTY